MPTLRAKLYVRHNIGYGCVALLFHPSCFKRGISRERILYVIEHCPQPLDQPEEDGEDLVVFLGDDWRGVPLEVGAIEITGGDLLIIHAMGMRDKYAEDYERVTGWQES